MPADNLQENRTAESSTHISDRYEIRRTIGGGAAGAVYEAMDKSLRKLVAIKKLHNTSNAVDLIRFQREAQLAGSLTHPNVRAVLDFGLTSKNEPYLVLELAKGESVAHYLKQHGQMEVEMALHVLIQVAAGLEHAHKRTIVHRDIKPSNVLLVEQGNSLIAQIVDFGIAKSTTTQDLTTDGQGIGTPLFMSPEQIRGEEVDQRTDIYSFGCLMYQMLTGHPPFVGSTVVDTTQMHLNAPVPALSDKSQDYFSESLEAIIRKSLAKNPDERYSKISDLSSDLEQGLKVIQRGNSNVRRAEPDSTNYGKLNLATTINVVPETRKVKMTTWALSGLAFICVVVSLCLLPMYFSNDHQAVSDPSKRADPFTNYFGYTPPFLLSHGTWIGEAHATDKDLATLASDYGTLKCLDLGVALKITSRGLLSLRNKKVGFLTFTERDVDYDGFRNISKIQSLLRLRLGGKGTKVDSSGVGLLANCPQFTELGLFLVSVDDSLLSEIAKLKNVQVLGFESCKGIKDANWQLLQPLARLNTVNFDDTDLDDAALERFMQTNHLTVLSLKGTIVSEECLNKFLGTKALQTVYVSGCPKISKKAIKKWREQKLRVFSSDSRYSQRVLHIPLESQGVDSSKEADEQPQDLGPKDSDKTDD